MRPALLSFCLAMLAGFFPVTNVSGMGAVAGGPEITAIETEWINMGMMGPGDTSRHRQEIDREAREIRHSILINGVERDPYSHAPYLSSRCGGLRGFFRVSGTTAA